MGHFMILGQGIISWLILDIGQNTSTVSAANLEYAMLDLTYLVILIIIPVLLSYLRLIPIFTCHVTFTSFYTESHQGLPVFMTDPFSFASFSFVSPQVLREETLALSLDITCFGSACTVCYGCFFLLHLGNKLVFCFKLLLLWLLLQDSCNEVI